MSFPMFHTLSSCLMLIIFVRFAIVFMRRHHCCQITTFPITCHVSFGCSSNRLKPCHLHPAFVRSFVHFLLFCIIYFVSKMTRKKRVHHPNARPILWRDSGLPGGVDGAAKRVTDGILSTLFHLMQNCKSNAMHKWATQHQQQRFSAPDHHKTPFVYHIQYQAYYHITADSRSS